MSSLLNGRRCLQVAPLDQRGVVGKAVATAASSAFGLGLAIAGGGAA